MFKKFKKWLFIKALYFVLNNINRYEDIILSLLDVDPKLRKIIDIVTDLLLALYIKWRSKKPKSAAQKMMPKMETGVIKLLEFKDKLDPLDVRYQEGEDVWDHIEGEEEHISKFRKLLKKLLKK